MTIFFFPRKSSRENLRLRRTTLEILAPRVIEVSELIFLRSRNVRYRTSSAVIANLRALSSAPDDPRDVSRWQLPPNIGQRAGGGGRGRVTRALEIGRWCFTSCRAHERQLKQYHSTLPEEAGVNESRISRRETFSIDDLRARIMEK